MTSSFYHSIVTDEHFRAASKRQRLAVEREIDRRGKQFATADLKSPLSVSFPTQAGYSYYDIQATGNSESVGAAFASDKICVHNQSYARVSIVLLPELLDAVAVGNFELKSLEVMLGVRFLGEVRKSGDHYEVLTPKGNSSLRLTLNHVEFREGNRVFKFPLQLDNDRIPNLFAFLSKAPMRNNSIVYDPAIQSTCPLVVMAFVLVTRMVYGGSDF